MADLPDLQDVDKIHLESLPLDNKELWLISLPSEVDSKTLNGLKIKMDHSATQKLQIKENSYCVEATKHTSTRTKVTPLIPTGKTGKLSFHRMMGEIVLKRELEISDEVITTEPSMKKAKKDEDALKHLKQRWQPFGWKTPPLLKANLKKKKKKKNKDRTN